MKTTFIMLIASLFFILQSCNILYKTKSTNIEILTPGKAKMPKNYKNVAIQYNNCNAALNPIYAMSSNEDLLLRDKLYSDSLASWVYINAFHKYLKDQQFFDTIVNAKSIFHNGVALNDSLIISRFSTLDTTNSDSAYFLNPAVLQASKLIDKLPDSTSGMKKDLYIDPDYGLHTKYDIEKIAQQTGADFLLSLDFFGVLDGLFSPDYFKNLPDSLKFNYINNVMNHPDFAYRRKSDSKGNSRFSYGYELATQVINVIASWSIYDLKKTEFTFFHTKIDSLYWTGDHELLRLSSNSLPPLRDVIFDASNISGINFAQFISPHWVSVERNYYKSRYTDLKVTYQLIKKQRWIEAAEILKRNVYNKNKIIAAKSMYNMAFVCEMNGEFDAAMDWAIKSFHVFGSKNQKHSDNCTKYINIIAQRKLDIQKIEGLQ
jgi:hypothetical protein